jgi:hypothetical protein
VGGPVPTVEGYADLLSTVAVVDPGLAVANAVGDVDVDAISSVWRDASEAVHAALADADPARYDGVAVYETDGAAPELVASLARAARSPEPIALAIGADAIGIASRDDGGNAGEIDELVDAVAQTASGDSDVTARYGVVRDPTDVTETAIVEATREAR